MNPTVSTALDQLVIARHLRTETASGSSLTRARRSGRLVPLAHGIDLPTEACAGLSPSELAELRAIAVAKHGRARRPLARASAALVWGVPLLGDPPDKVHVLGSGPASTRSAGGMRYWGTAHPDVMVAERHGVRVTSLARTLAEFASASTFAAGVVAVDWGVRVNAHAGEPSVSLEEIAEAADLLEMRRGRAQLQRVLEFADGRSESPGESWSRVLIRRLGFEAPDLQVVVRGRNGEAFRADFGWRDASLLGEFDGHVKYVSGSVRGARSASDVVVQEKLREDSVRASGHGVCRWVWSDLVHPHRLAAILTVAGAPRRR